MRQLNRQDIATILDRYLQGKSTPEETAIVRRWFESQGNDVRLYVDSDAREDIKKRIIDRIAQSVDGSPFSKAATTQSRHTQVKRFKLTLNPNVFHAYRKLAAAAVITIALVVSAWLLLMPADSHSSLVVNNQSEEFSEISNKGASVKDVLLDDGSTVKLQPNSTLHYNDVKTSSTRVVTLTGEAYFEVAHDKNRPFIVYAGATRTRVVGTSFTIKAPGLNMDVSVTVRTGTVAVSKEQSQQRDEAQLSELMLTPNQKVIYNRELDKFSTALVDLPVLLPEYVNRESMQFDDESVVLVLERLQSVYGVHIDFDRKVLANCRISLKFTTEGLFERLNIVSKAIGATYERDGTQINFIAHGC